MAEKQIDIDAICVETINGDDLSAWIPGDNFGGLYPLDKNDSTVTV